MLNDLKGVPIGHPHYCRLGTINHLRLTVRDILRSRTFYGALMGRLGYRLVEESGSRLAWASWAPHGTLHWLILSTADPQKRQAHDRYTPGLHHLAWNVETRDEVDAIYKAMVEQGVAILDPPDEYGYEPGYYAFFFEDPDGLKLEIMNVDPAGSYAYWQSLSQVSVS